jgi:DNA-binding beta-propeller fold protein YncE
MSPIALDVNPTNGYVYILDWDPVNLDYWRQAIHILSGTQVITATGSERHWWSPQDGNVRVNPATGYVYVARHNYPFENSDLTILSGTQVITSLPLSIGPIGISPASGYVYLGSKFSDTVTVMSGTEVIGTLPVGLVPSDIQVNPRTGLLSVSLIAKLFRAPSLRCQRTIARAGADGVSARWLTEVYDADRANPNSTRCATRRV